MDDAVMGVKGTKQKPRSEEHCRKISEAAKLRYQLKPQPKGEDNPKWIPRNKCCDCGKELSINRKAVRCLDCNIKHRQENEWAKAGVFSVYITGGAFTTKTLVSTVGGSGTNPVTDNTYTTSKWFVLDLDANDRITNIKMYKGIPVQ